MMNEKKGNHNDKISSEFASRLARFGSERKVRAVVLLQTKGAASRVSRRQSPVERGVAIETIQKSAQQALGEIDNILKRFGGRRLTDTPDSVGSILVETTPAGINSLVESKSVNAILENQKAFLTR